MDDGDLNAAGEGRRGGGRGATNDTDGEEVNEREESG